MTDDETRGGTALTEAPGHILEDETAQEVEPEAGGGLHGAGAGHDIHLPPQSLWPIALAFAITIAAFGLVTNWLVSVPGLLIFVLALRGWTQELLHGGH